MITIMITMLLLLLAVACSGAIKPTTMKQATTTTMIFDSIFSTNKIPSNKKLCIITGANSGIGYAAVKNLCASNEYKVIMACRDIKKAEKAASGVVDGKDNIEIMKLDLADLDSVRDFAKAIKKTKRTIDVLALNAGIQESESALPGKKGELVAARSKQDYEITIGTNHIAHFALVNLLLSNINSKSGRIVFVGSGVHNPDEPGGNVGSKAGLGDMIGLQEGFKSPISMIDGSPYDPDKAYKDSKLCNVMTALELAKRLKDKKSKITCNVMNPGLIPTTGLFRKLNPIFTVIFTFLTRYVFKVATSEEEGGRRLTFMIDDGSLNSRSGVYYSGKPGKEFEEITPSTEARDEKKRKLFWNLSATLLGRVSS